MVWSCLGACGVYYIIYVVLKLPSISFFFLLVTRVLCNCYNVELVKTGCECFLCVPAPLVIMRLAAPG